MARLAEGVSRTLKKKLKDDDLTGDSCLSGMVRDCDPVKKVGVVDGGAGSRREVKDSKPYTVRMGTVEEGEEFVGANGRGRGNGRCVNRGLG